MHTGNETTIEFGLKIRPSAEHSAAAIQARFDSGFSNANTKKPQNRMPVTNPRVIEASMSYSTGSDRGTNSENNAAGTCLRLKSATAKTMNGTMEIMAETEGSA